MPKIQLNLPDDLVKQLDRLAMSSVRRPMRMMEWLTQTPEGQRYWAGQRTKTYLSEMQMNAEVRRVWIEATGGLQVGRPNLMPRRVEVIREALMLYEQAHPAKSLGSAPKKVLPLPLTRRS